MDTHGSPLNALWGKPLAKIHVFCKNASQNVHIWRNADKFLYKNNNHQPMLKSS